MELGQEDDVLEPIPANFVDMAIREVRRRSAPCNGTPPPSGQPAAPQPCLSPTPRPPQTEAGAAAAVPPPQQKAVKYFKGADGTEFKLVDDVLYVKAWKALEVKHRILRSDNGRELPMNGKTVQVYGWVKAAPDEVENDDAADIEEMEDVENG